MARTIVSAFPEPRAYFPEPISASHHQNGSGSHAVGWKSGDVLVLLSDGLIEATDSDDEEFGLSRIKGILLESTALKAQEIVDRLMQANQRFVAGHLDQVDDRTILVIKVE